MQILNRPHVEGSFGDSFDQMMDQLKQVKMQQLLQQHQGRQYQALVPGADPAKAQAFAALHPLAQKEFIKSGLLGTLQADQPMQQNSSPYDALMGQNIQQQSSNVNEVKPNELDRSQAKPAEMQPNAVNDKAQPNIPEQVKSQSPYDKARNQLRATLKNKLATTAQKNAAVKQLSAIDKQEKIDRSESIKRADEAQKALDLQYKPYIENLDKKGGLAAKETDLTLTKLEKLIDTGKLTGPTMYNFRKKLEHHGGEIGAGVGTALGGLVGGIVGSTALPGVGTVGGAMTGGGIGAGLGKAIGETVSPKFVGSKEDQEFNKLTMGFLRNMKDIFGSRVAIQEMQAFMDSIPNLSMTDEGKKAVIHDMKLMSATWRHRKQIKDKLISANKGHSIPDLENKVEEIAKPYLKTIKKQFLDTNLQQVEL